LQFIAKVGGGAVWAAAIDWQRGRMMNGKVPE
jgi:hypothetical protein